MKLLLNIFNYIWKTGDFPQCWSEATVIPIPKPGKDHSDPNNYRPISLTSCVCKTLERMINDRLVWYLENNKILTDIQCRFRKRKSTLDHLVRLESFIRDAFLNKQEVVSIFFDLEKAYDTTWNKQIQRIVVPRSATNLTLKKVKGHRQGHDMVPPERSCHKEHTCQVSKLYL